MRLLILSGYSRYGVHGLISEQLAAGFEEVGWDVDLFDPLHQEEKQLRFTRISYDLVLSCNGSASIIPYRSSNLFQELRIPQIVLLTDHPLHCLPRLRPKIDRRMVLCIDPAHIEVAKRLVLPHNPVEFLAQAAFEGDVGCDERPIDLLLTGSNRPSSDSWKRLEQLQRERPEVPICDRALSADLDENPNPLELVGEPLDLDDPVRCEMVAEVELYIRNRRREQMVEMLLDRGLRLTVVGEGWEPRPGLECRPPLEAIDAFTLMGEAKMVLDLPLLFQYGAHERGLSAMAAGAVGVVPDNPFFDDHFDCKQDLLAYRWLERKLLPDQIEALLRDEPTRLEMAQRGRARVSQGHTWRQRAHEIAELALAD